MLVGFDEFLKNVVNEHLQRSGLMMIFSRIVKEEEWKEEFELILCE